MAHEPIRLDAADYWQLRYRLAAMEVVRLRAQLTVSEAEAQREAWVQALAQKYPDFDPGQVQYLTDDNTCTLTRTE